MYVATTHSIRVTVKPSFLSDQSVPEENHYVWAYHVQIENRGSESVQLKSRYWKITDANGHVQEVRGAGVIGETPHIEPKKTYEYTSGTPLNTPSGIMEGSYQMETSKGENLQVVIPAFSLDSPYQFVSLN